MKPHFPLLIAKTKIKELGIQVGIGLFLIAVGIALNVVSERQPVNLSSDGQTAVKVSNDVHVDRSQVSDDHVTRTSWTAIVHHIGTAILTAGMLMVTVELYTKYREARNHDKIKQEQERYISLIHDAHGDALLSALVPDQAIFDQIKSEIIQQPFIRRNMEAEVHLKWNESRTAIRKVLCLSFDVENTSTISGPATVRVRLATGSEDDLDSRIELVEIAPTSGELRMVVPGKDEVQVIDDASPMSLSEAELGKCGIVTRTKNDIQAFFRIELASRQSARITYKQRTIEKLADSCTIYCTIPTVGMNVRINPEPGILVDGTFLHPSGQLIRNDEEVTHLEIAGAILPYQGIDFSWDATTPKSAAQFTNADPKQEANESKSAENNGFGVQETREAKPLDG